MSARFAASRFEDVQLDEAWTFVAKKERRKRGEERSREDIGDQYVFIAIERHTKLVLAWHLGRRDNPNAWDFITKVRDATAPQRFQLSSDAFSAYRGAIDAGLHDRADYAQIIKMYGSMPGGRDYYRPAKIKGTISAPISGRPDQRRICTSHVERKNGSLRQWCKRLTRLTYAFSRKLENLRAALALHFAYYNFCRVHSAAQGHARDGERRHGSRLGSVRIDLGMTQAEFDAKYHEAIDDLRTTRALQVSEPERSQGGNWRVRVGDVWWREYEVFKNAWTQEQAEELMARKPSPR